MNIPAIPVVNVVVVALVIAGDAGLATVRVKFWVASGRTPLAAVMVNG